MSTLRVSNIEAKADPSSPSVNEKVKITNSNGDVMLQLDGATPGITTVGINTTTAAFTVDSAQNIQFVGIVTATNGFSGNLTGTASTATAAATAYGISGSPTLSGITSVSTTNLTVNGNAYPSSGSLSNRNHWINGAMAVDQRRSGSSKSSAVDGDFIVDRLKFECPSSANSKCNIGQNLNSITPPSGFKNYAGLQVTSTYSLGVTDQINMSRWLEGYSVADFDLGTANAKQFTVSFWVRSSVTGTYGLMLVGYDNVTFRSHIKEYTINSANTWEYKTITVQGDTSTTITWGSTNGYGMFIGWSLGAGTNVQTTADTWTTGLYRSTSNQTNLFDTNGATFYLTGVQLEVGTVATPFEHRSYGDELARCQRYYYNGGEVRQYSAGYSVNARGTGSWINFPVTMRDTANVTQSGITYSGANTAQVHNASAHGFTSYFISQADNTTWCQFTYVAEKEL